MTNEVLNKHPSYDENALLWKECRDFIEGSKKVKAEGETYLAKLSGQDDIEYKAYKERALFYNATGRTIQALLGAIFRKPTIVEPPTTYIEVSAQSVTNQVLSVGRCGVLVDLPKDGGDPYFVIYNAEQIRNWSYETIGDQKVLQSVILEENYLEYNAEEFKHTEKKRLRVLDLESAVPEDVEESQQIEGLVRYRVRVYEEGEEDNKTPSPTGASTSLQRKTSWQLKETIYPLMMGEVMDFIPFQIFNSTNLDPDCEKPPLMDLVEVNKSHYRTSADLEHGRHFTALPTAWVAGFPKDSELKIGSATAWVTDDVNAKAGFLEFTGQGLQALEKGLDQKERLMAILGARLFESNRQGVESAETTRLRQSADTATAAHVSRNVSEGITRCYQWALNFAQFSAETAFVNINTDLLDNALDPANITALLTAWQSGAISMETLLWNFKQGEILPPDRDVETERSLIETDMLRVRDFSNFISGGNTGAQ